MAALGPRRLLGINSIFDATPPAFSAEAILGDASLFAFEGDAIRRLVLKYPQLGLALIKHLSDTVGDLSKMLVDIG